MSQIDTISYFPSLFWFFLNFVLFYFLILTYILPLLYTALKVRFYFLFKLENILIFSEIYMNKFNMFFFNFNKKYFSHKNLINFYNLLSLIK